MTKDIFDLIIKTRQAFIKLIEEQSTENINEIPEGFNNNIIWNFGHIVVSTPVLCYIRTGVRTTVDSIPYIDKYKKGTKPEVQISEEEIDTLKRQSIGSIHQLQQDFEKGVFQNIQPFETSTYGNRMETIEAVLLATLAHDNLHYGYAKAQNKEINKHKKQPNNIY